MAGCQGDDLSTPTVAPPGFFIMMENNKYQFTPGMCEVSGFGGDYEECCRKMIAAGCRWFDEHPEGDPHFQEIKDVYGICIENNEDAKSLSKAMTEVVKGEGITGAMHQAAVNHVLVIRRNGWDWYVAKMEEPDGE